MKSRRAQLLEFAVLGLLHDVELRLAAPDGDRVRLALGKLT